MANLAALSFLLLATANPAQAAEPAGGAAISPVPSTGPRIHFQDPVFDFGKVDAGDPVKHRFVFTNQGDAVLEVQEVAPACGCTTAGNWDRQVAPGESGVLAIELQTASFGGPISKAVAVRSNDPSQPTVTLLIKGNIWRPIEVTPISAYFNIPSEAQTSQTKVVRILNRLDKPVTLSKPECTNRLFQANLKTIRPGLEYELSVTALPPFDGSYIQAPIRIETSHPDVPVVTVNAVAVVQPTVLVMPNQLLLPADPSTTPLPAVTVLNNWTNAVTLAEPAINIPGAGVQIQELQPGRLFRLTVTLPKEFEVKPGQEIEVTVKSSHPKFPILRVPVVNGSGRSG